MSEYDQLLSNITARLTASNQLHVLSHIDDPANTPESKLAFLKAIDVIPLESLSDYLKGALEEEEKLKNFDPSNVSDPNDVIEPFRGKVMSTTSTSKDDIATLKEATDIGFDAISKGQ
eukprot:scaffold6048_cov90-Cyclotella_meneghiniana.AAC.1